MDKILALPSPFLSSSFLVFLPFLSTPHRAWELLMTIRPPFFSYSNTSVMEVDPISIPHPLLFSLFLLRAFFPLFSSP